LDYQIYEGQSPEKLYIKIDGNLISDNISGNVTSLELANYVSTAGLHTIEVGSYGTANNENGLGRINANIYVKYFCGM
jgi:hypothetical protein